MLPPLKHLLPSRPHKKSVFKARQWEKPHQWGGGLNRSVLICIWSCDFWGEGWIRKAVVHRETRGVRFQFCEGLESESLKLPLFDCEPERERGGGGECEAFSLEWVSGAGRVRSISLSYRGCHTWTGQLYFGSKLTVTEDDFTVNERHFVPNQKVVLSPFPNCFFVFLSSIPPWFFGIFLLVLRFCSRRSSAQLLDGMCSLRMRFFFCCWRTFCWLRSLPAEYEWMVKLFRSAPGN